MKNFRSDENGQAVVEYVLALSIAITIFAILAIGFRKSLFKLWTALTRETAAACPTCPADPNIR